MPSVQVAWYSKRELDVYHVCTNCSRSKMIYYSHVEFTTRERARRIIREANPDVESETGYMCVECFRKTRPRSLTPCSTLEFERG